MAIELITNQLWTQAARVIATDTAGAEVDSTLYPSNVVGGGNHLFYGPSGAADRRLLYVNMNGGMGINRLIVTRANSFNGLGAYVLSWGAAYPASPTTHFGSVSFAETLVGPLAKDWVYSFSSAITGKYAIGLELGGAVAKYIGKLYGGTALSMKIGAPPVITPFWSQVQLFRQVYLTDFRAEIVFDDLTATDVNTLENLASLKTEPFFLYDADGYTFKDKLWHGVLLDLRKVQVHDNLYAVQLSTARIRSY